MRSARVVATVAAIAALMPQLASAAFVATDLINADLSNANLTYAYFTGGCDLTGANFADLNAPHVEWGNSICPDGQINGDCCYQYVGAPPEVCYR